MKTKFLAIVTGMGMLSVGAFFVSHPNAEARAGSIEERWVNANLLQVRMDDRWREVPLMPLAEYVCQSQDPHFQQYCE